MWISDCTLHITVMASSLIGLPFGFLSGFNMPLNKIPVLFSRKGDHLRMILDVFICSDGDPPAFNGRWLDALKYSAS